MHLINQTFCCRQHSMIYFFHHFELPAIMQQARVREIIAESQNQVNNNNLPNNNGEGTNQNLNPTPNGNQAQPAQNEPVENQQNGPHTFRLNVAGQNITATVYNLRRRIGNNVNTTSATGGNVETQAGQNQSGIDESDLSNSDMQINEMEVNNVDDENSQTDSANSPDNVQISPGVIESITGPPQQTAMGSLIQRFVGMAGGRNSENNRDNSENAESSSSNSENDSITNNNHDRESIGELSSNVLTNSSPRVSEDLTQNVNRDSDIQENEDNNS